MSTMEKASHSERITFLATPALKSTLTSLAAASGISIGEFLRRRVLEDNDSDVTEEQQEELAALIEQVNQSIPRINDSLEAMSQTIRELRAENDVFFRKRGNA